jgi:choline dehydrogenase-like flavoprotein
LIVNNDLDPNPTQLRSNATYNEEVFQQYLATKTGPYAMSQGNCAAFLPYKTVVDNSTFLASIAKIRGQNASIYLPSTYDHTLVAGYRKILDTLADQYESSNSAVFEFPVSGGLAAISFQKPLSRGTVYINAANPLGDPVIDYRTLSNPMDLESVISMLKYVRKVYRTPSVQTLGPVELVPGANVTTDAEITDALITSVLIPSFAHPAGTCSLMPRELGGVVDPNLNVYGTKKLRVIDASIIPLLPATHIQQTVYAIAEKAADLILGDQWL